MRVSDVMTANPVSCQPEALVRAAAALMTVYGCSAIPVTSSGKLVGIITNRDITCRAVAVSDAAPLLPVGEVMSRAVIALRPDEPIEAAIDLMEENRVHHLPVIDREGALVGIIAQSDLAHRLTNREFGRIARQLTVRSTIKPRSAAIVLKGATPCVAWNH